MRWIKHDEAGNRLPGDYAMRQDGPGEWIDPVDLPASPPVMPMTVSRFQALAALMQAGLLDEVKAWADAPGADPLQKLAFETAAEFTSTSPAVRAGAAALGWSDEKLLALFHAASRIIG